MIDAKITHKLKCRSWW